MPIKASAVGAQIFQILADVVDEEYKGESEQVKQEAMARILNAMSVQMFG